MQHADALEAVVDRALGAELGVRAKQRELETQAGDRGLEAGADLGDDLLQALRLHVEPRHEVGDELDEGLGVPVERATRHDKRLQVVVARREGLDLRRGADPTRGGRDARRDLGVVLAGSSALGEHATEQREQVLLLRAEPREIASHVEVGDAVRRLGIELDRRRAEAGVAAGHVLELHRDVGELESGQRGEVLLRLLLGLEPERVLDDPFSLGVGEAGFDRRETIHLGLALALLELGVRDGGQQRAVRVVEQLGADEGLEEAAFGAGLLEALQVGVEVEGGDRIALVVVRGQAREQQAKRVGKAGVGALALLELEMVDRGVDLLLFHAVVRQPLQRVEHDLLNLLGVLGHDALETGAEDRFLVIVLQPATVGQRAAEARVDERFTEWRAGVRQQHLGKDLHCQRAERVRARHRDPRSQRLRLARVVLGRGGRVGLDRGHRLRRPRDVRDLGVDLHTLEPR